MARIIKWLGGLAALPLVLVLGIYFSAEAPSVLATVVDDPELPSVSVNGVRLHAEAFGDPEKPALIVLHGGPGNDYRGLLPLKPLADAYHLVFYDQRGSGLSERVPAEKLTLELFIDDLHQVRQHFAKDRPVALVGHSWGAMLATAYMARHPDGVSAAVLAEPGFLTPELGQAFMEKTNHMMPPLSWPVVRTLARAWGESLHVGGPDDYAAMDHFIFRLATTPVPGHPIRGYFCDDDLKNASFPQWRPGALVGGTLIGNAQNEDGEIVLNLSEGIERYPGPVLLIAGSCDRLIGENVQKEHQALFADARLEIIEGAGHTMFGEKPEASMALIREFLRSAGHPPSPLTAPGEPPADR